MHELLIIDGEECQLYKPKDEINDFHSMVKEHLARALFAFMKMNMFAIPVVK